MDVTYQHALNLGIACFLGHGLYRLIQAELLHQKSIRESARPSARATRKSINDLPHELLLPIAEYLAQQDEEDDGLDISKNLCSMSLANKRLNAAATPSLYRNAKLLDGARTLEIHRSFLRTITTLPCIAYPVKSLTTMLPCGKSDPIPATKALMAFLEIAPALVKDPHFQARLGRSLESGNHGAQVAAILLALSPTLESLKLVTTYLRKPSEYESSTAPGLGFTEETLLAPLLMRPSFTDGTCMSYASSFTKLKSVKIQNHGHNGLGYRLPFESLLFMLELPCLTHLCARRFGPITNPAVPGKLFPGQSKVKKLTFEDCLFESLSWDLILGRCSAMSHLEFKGLVYNDYIDRASFFRSLQAHATSLVLLRLPGLWLWDMGASPPVTSMHSFTSLFKLQGSTTLFSNWDDTGPGPIMFPPGHLNGYLPPNLETLDLTLEDQKPKMSDLFRTLSALPQAATLTRVRIRLYESALKAIGLQSKPESYVGPVPGLQIKRIVFKAELYGAYVTMLPPFRLHTDGPKVADEVESRGFAASFTKTEGTESLKWPE